MSEAEIPERGAEQIVSELTALVNELDRYKDSELREKALDLVQLILELYGDALRRILATFDSLPLKDQIISRLIGDEVIRAILLIHGLLPMELHERVAVALEHARPYLISQGADVELTGVDDGRARIRLIRKGSGAPPIALLRAEIEKLLGDAAPDLIGIDIEGLNQSEITPQVTGVERITQLSPEDAPQATRLVQIKARPPEKKSSREKWVSMVRALDFEEGQLKIVNFAEVNVLVCKTGGEFYAYQNGCAVDNRPLNDSLFEDPMLTCSCHGYRYDLRRAGACVEMPDLRLTPLPARAEDDKIKVLLP